MFCPKCGKEIDDNAVICPGCGCPVANIQTRSADKRSFGYALIGFFVPLIGLILYLVYHDSRPLRAKSAGKGALIKALLYVLLIVLYIVLNIVLIYMRAIPEV